MSATAHRRIGGPAALALAAALLAAGGCGHSKPMAAIDVERPEIGRAQAIDKFHMATRSAVYGPLPGGGVRVLMGFPLPGGKNPNRARLKDGDVRTYYTYYLYLDLAPGSEVHLFAAGNSQRGVLLHATGEAGQTRQLSEVVAGHVTVDLSGSGDLLRGRFALVCADQVRLTGEFAAEPNEPALARFEEEYAAALHRPEWAPP